MPLRDHFQPPIAGSRQWFSTLTMFASTAMCHLQDVANLPQQYIPDLDIKRGEFVESSYVPEGFEPRVIWRPEEAHAHFNVAVPAQDRVELRYLDESRQLEPAAAIQFVTEDNKRDETARQSFAVKCAERLRQGFSVVVIDLVTTEGTDLLRRITGLVGVELPDALRGDSPAAYSLRTTRTGGWRLEIWREPCAVGKPLPTLPLWLADDLALPLELEQIYEETCRVSRIP